MERVCRLACNGVPAGHLLSEKPDLTADQVRDWVRYLDTSPLYQHLVGVIASDPDLMRVLNRIDHTPRLNVLFAGVQFLMMRDGGDGLARHYPNFSGETVHDGVNAAFTSFVLANEQSLVEIGLTRYTQTNECRRCVVLLAGIWETPATAFHLVDVGASAGLNLLMDKYHYRVGGVEWGPRSAVDLTSEVRSGNVEARDIEILSRTGLDLHPIDPANADDALWLQALVWPENHERRRRLQAALGVAATEPPRVLAGDALETLPPVLAELPGEDPAVVMNSFVLNQLSGQQRDAVASIIEDHRSIRPVYRVSVEWLDADDEGASLSVDDGSGMRKVGLAHPHGEWVELYARP